LHGFFDSGLALYESRLILSSRSNKKRSTSCAQWAGDIVSTPAGITVLHEQGFGDSIHFSRYIPSLVPIFKEVIFEVPEELFNLYASSNLVSSGVKLRRQGNLKLTTEYYCSLMSLPYLLRLPNPPEALPTQFFLANPKTFARLNSLKLKIGLVWSGSKTHQNDRNRTIPLALLKPILELDAEYHSLQIEYRETDLVVLGQFSIIRDHSKKLTSFEDTARLLEDMDLVISVDSSVAHLAGSLGKPLLLLLPFVPDFRWGLHTEKSSLYPTAKLFRQPSLGDWGAVVSQLKSFIETLLKEYSQRKINE
jgi:hypothetical protein